MNRLLFGLKQPPGHIIILNEVITVCFSKVQYYGVLFFLPPLQQQQLLLVFGGRLERINGISIRFQWERMILERIKLLSHGMAAFVYTTVRSPIFIVLYPLNKAIMFRPQTPHSSAQPLDIAWPSYNRTIKLNRS